MFANARSEKFAALWQQKLRITQAPEPIAAVEYYRGRDHRAE
jgi:hypothetical protein